MKSTVDSDWTSVEHGVSYAQSCLKGGKNASRGGTTSRIQGELPCKIRYLERKIDIILADGGHKEFNGPPCSKENK